MPDAKDLAANLKDLAAQAVNVVHRATVQLTGGRLGTELFGMPTVELTTTGRKTGQARTSMLTSPVHDDQKVVLVASYGGDSRHPAWFLNLRENPDVEIRMFGEQRKMRARVATTEERAVLWPKVIASYRGYAQYQRQTEREIPLVILEEASTGSKASAKKAAKIQQSPGTKKPAKKTTAKKATAKKTTAKKTTAKKATTNKATEKSTTKKNAAKKAASEEKGTTA